MAKIAVTGANGFIGRHFIKFLKEKKHTVIKVTHNKYDLRSIIDTYSALSGAEYVVHLAADMGGVGYFTTHDYYPFIRNMLMDLNILQVCEKSGVKRLLYASSACVYPMYLQDNPDDPKVLGEALLDTPAQPDQMYGWEKLMGLKLCQRAPFETRVAILNTVYGPDCDISGERMKAPAAIAMKCIEAQKTGKPIKIWGDGRQVRQFLYIDDACEMLYELLMKDNYNGPVNISYPLPQRILSFYELCTNILGIEAKCEFELDKPTGAQARMVSTKKWNETYLHRPRIGYEEGFRRLIEWIQTKE